MHSQNMMKNMLIGKFRDVESVSVSQVDGESGNMNRDRSLDIIREPSYQTNQTLTPEKNGDKK